MKIYSTLSLFALPLALTPGHLLAQENKELPQLPIPDVNLQKPPVLLVKQGKDKTSTPLLVETLDVKTTVTGNTAETTMTMTFRNDTDRILEGELVFPLGQGMTVSGYALEVNGKMRQGVIVLKDLARKVYEDTIRQKIDPGLVEWTKGNNFRTRIYPVPAKGTKKVSISYVEPLRSNGKELNYQLPLAFKEKIANFNLDITVVRPGGKQKVTINEDAGLKLNIDDERQWTLKAEQKDFTANKSLRLSIPHENIAKQLVYKNNRDEIFFYALDKVDHEAKKFDRPKPKTLHLIWDASNSGAKRDHVKELKLLDDYLTKTKAQSLTLQLLRNTLGEPQEFQLNNGSKKLIEHLSSLRYDGATRLSKADFSKIKADATLFVSDGISTLGQDKPKVGDKPVFIFHASQSAEHNLLNSLAAKSGGAYVNLHNQKATIGLDALTTQAFSLLSINGLEPGDEESEIYPSVSTPVSNHAAISGKLSSDKPVTLTLNYGVAGKVMHTSTIKIDPKTEDKEANKVPRLWAQQKLMELEAAPQKNRAEIISVAQHHKIVTRFTSLLVLDRIEDYVRHRINPPEPELQEKYDNLLRKQQNIVVKKAKHIDGVVAKWEKMVDWHQAKYLTAGDVLVKRTSAATPQLDKHEKKLKLLIAEEKDEKIKAQQKSLIEQIARVRKIQKDAITWKNKHSDIHAGPDDKFKEILVTFDKEFAIFSNRRPSKKNENQTIVRNLSEDAPASDGIDDAEVTELQAAAPSSNRLRLNTDKKATKAQAPRKAGIALAKWDPNTPYLKALRKAVTDKQDLETLYFDWKAKNLRSSAFYLDVADFFIKQDKQTIALRVLSNVAELDIDDPALMRILGHRYDQLEKYEQAELIFKEILELRPEEPQSYRDLALVLEKRGKFQEAADKLWHVATHKWNNRLRDIELIALTELNAIIAKNKGKVKTNAYDSRVIYNLDSDVRIVLTWDADNTDIDLWVTGPMGEKCFYSHDRTQTGGLMSRDFTQGYGPEVFMIKNAINGEYSIQANYYGSRQQKLAGDTTIQASLVTNWGRPNEKREAITLRLKNKKEVVNVGKFNFSSGK